MIKWGSIAPGKEADILLVDQPETFNVQTVISKGQVVMHNHEVLEEFTPPQRSAKLQGTLKLAPVQAADFAVKVESSAQAAKVRTIKSVGPFVRKQRDVSLPVNNGVIQPSAQEDVALVSVLERYGINHKQAHGFISGWSLKKGAIATTVAPDDNNLVVAGMQTADMALAVNTLIECGGGQVVVADGQVLALLKLPLGGITTDLTPQDLAQKELELKKAAEHLGCHLPDPLFYLSFLPITAIPDLAITDGGNVDSTKLKYFDPILAVE